VEQLSREDIGELAGEVLRAMGVEKVEIGEEEKAVIEGIAEAWMRNRAREKDEGI